MRYIAFLRAINVGGRTVTMPRLKQLFESGGATRVETFIASGNVVFDSTSRSPAVLERRIVSHLHTALGYQVDTFIRTPGEVAAIAAHQPFAAKDIATTGAVLYVVFLAARPGAAVKKQLLDASTRIDSFHFADRELYWLSRKRFVDSEFSGPRLEKMLGMPATVRNVNTVRRLAAKYPPA